MNPLAVLDTPCESRLRTSAWGQWMAFLDDALEFPANIQANQAVQLFRRFLGLHREALPSEIVAKAAKRMPLQFRSAEAVPPGTGKITIQPELGLFWESDEFVVELGRATKRRTEFIQIHELAHAILYSFLCHSRFSPNSKQLYGRLLTREQFCNEFARELLLPKHKIKNISLALVEKGWSDGERLTVEGLWGAGGPRLTYQHIRSMAARLAVSIRFVVSVLHRHKLLDEVACGIAIMRVSPNRETGELTALRIWQMACPSWGFVIPNRRVSRQGFMSASDVYGSAASQTTEVRSETLLVWKQSAELTVSETKKRWTKTRLMTNCAYTPVDVRDEGRYLVAVWSWPRDVG
jgi:hypothetical protein